MLIDINEDVIERGILELRNYPNELVQDMILELSTAIKDFLQFESDAWEDNQTIEDLGFMSCPCEE